MHKSPPPYLLKNLADYSKHLAATSHRRGTDAAISGRSDTNDTLVNGSLNAVVLLDVQPRQDVGFDTGGFLQIPGGGGVHDGADHEFTDGLILGHTAVAVGAAEDGGVAPAVLGPSVVPALGRHGFSGWELGRTNSDPANWISMEYYGNYYLFSINLIIKN